MSQPRLDVSVVVAAPAGRILKAFFDADALAAWWGVAHSVTSPRTLGPYAVEWAPTEFKDEVLGRLGGVFRGTVMQFDQNTGFFVADAFWLPPDGDPIGPMALEVSVKAEGPRDRDGDRGSGHPREQATRERVRARDRPAADGRGRS